MYHNDVSASNDLKREIGSVMFPHYEVGLVRKGKEDHVTIKMPNGQLITIPVSGDVKIGLLKAAIKKAGLSEPAFEKLL